MQRPSDRVLAAVLFTDIVESTTIAEELGDRRWKALVHEHHRMVRRAIKRHRGTEHDTAGDGFFAGFREPASAIACACEAAEAVRTLGIEIRAGIHFGECEQIGNKLGGITVVVGARIMSLGGAGDVLVSGTAAELSRGAGFGFEDRGMQRLKGVDDEWRVFAATAVDGTPRPGPTEPGDAKERRDQITPESPRRHRMFVAVGVALAVLVAAIAVPVSIRRLHQGLPAIDANAVGAIDPSNGHITDQVPLGDGPNGVAAGAGSEWVALETTDRVARIDPSTNTVVQQIDVQDDPIGVAYGAGAVWVTNSNSRSVSQIDPASNRVVRTIQVGNAPSAIAFGEESVWVTNTLDGTVSRIDPDTGHATTMSAGADPVAVAIGADSVWVANQASGEVARIDPAAGVVRPIPVGLGPSGLVFDGTDVWVANSQSGTVTRIDPTTNAVTGTVPTGGAPSQLATAMGRVWVTDAETNSIIEINPAGGGSIADTTYAASAPRSLAFDGDALWVTTRGSAASHQGGTLTAETSQLLGHGQLDPNTAWDATAYSILTNTNDGLLSFARVGGTAGSSLVPDLALSIPAPSADGKTYTFTMRPGVHYSDGSLVKPSDALFSFRRALLLGRGPVFYLDAVVGAKSCTRRDCTIESGIQPDDAAGTVTFHLTRRDPSFLSAVALPFLAIVPPTTPLRVVTDAPFVAATGPYMIDSFKRTGTIASPRETVDLVANPNFDEWSHAAQPAGFPERIEITFGVDPERATSHVEHGHADVLIDTPPTDRWQEIRTKYPAQSHPYLQLSIDYVFMNTKVAPFDNPDVRRAVNFAVDRQRMAGQLGAVGLWGGSGPVTCQVLPPNVPGYAPYCPYTSDRSSDGDPDVASAQQLVDVSASKAVPVTVFAPPFFSRTARYVASVLGNLGYDAKAHVFASANGYFAHVSNSANRAQIGVAGWQMDFPNPANMFGPVLTCRSFQENDPFNSNLAEYCNSPLDRLIRSAGRLAMTDPAKATALWRRIDRMAVDDAPWVPFVTPSGMDLVSAQAGNVQHNPVLGVLLGQIWVQ